MSAVTYFQQVNTDGIEFLCRRLVAVAVAGVLVLIAPLVAVAGASAARGAEASSARAIAGGHGLEVVSATRNGRVERVVVRTAALAQPVRINVILPVGYDSAANAGRRYPTLYLFHGTSGGAEDWLAPGRAIEASRGYPMIVVAPDAGYDSDGGSWFTNWVDQQTSLGTANWETFHIDQMIPWVDHSFRTDARRSQRAIAGLSQGGFGSLSYAARHPDLFVSGAAFSGAADIARDPRAQTIGAVVVGGIMTGLNQVEPNAPFGDPVTNAINWRGHNPANLVTNLADTDLELWTGNGEPGPLDDPSDPTGTPALAGQMAIEAIVHESATYFIAAAKAAGVDYFYDDYGPGTHAWGYWVRDLHAYLPRLARVFAQDRPTPRSIGYRSVDRAWRQWGWRVANQRSDRQAWSALRHADRAGFTFVGGRARITTPARYAPGATYALAYRRGDGPTQVVADRTGRLEIHLRATGTGPARVTIG